MKANVPSFLIECLVYNVANEHFTVAGDNRYERIKRVLKEIQKQLNSGVLYSLFLMEVNGIKPLFASGQAWTLQEARTFVDLTIAHLGDD